MYSLGHSPAVEFSDQGEGNSLSRQITVLSVDKQFTVYSLTDGSFYRQYGQTVLSVDIQFTVYSFPDREMLIFRVAIYSLWNHPFYCALFCPDFKTVFCFVSRYNEKQ